MLAGGGSRSRAIVAGQRTSTAQGHPREARRARGPLRYLVGLSRDGGRGGSWRGFGGFGQALGRVLCYGGTSVASGATLP